MFQIALKMAENMAKRRKGESFKSQSNTGINLLLSLVLRRFIPIIPKSSHYASQPSNRGGILQPFPLLLRLQTDLIPCHTGVTDFDKTCLIVVDIAQSQNKGKSGFS
jgi:hypothetical protein